jgi:hypothetical protein
MNLNGKNVLLLAPNFFEYSGNIKNELSALGANVEIFNERVSDKPIIKAIIRKRLHFLIYPLITNYYKKILDKVQIINFDYIFVINPEVINKTIFTKLSKNNRNVKTILYLWDSINNKPHFKELFSLFDSMWSFDYSDCQKNENLNFMPLFFDNSYVETSYRDVQIEFDLCFIGTVHSDRFAIVNAIKSQAENLGLKVYTFMYLPSKLMFFYKKCFDKGFKDIKYSELSYKPLKEDDVIEIMAKSKVIIDINHDLQTGLTSRTFETLASCKKLLTTNKRIAEFDFYDNRNVEILDRKNPRIQIDFFESEFNYHKAPLMDNYSISNWIKKIFSQHNKSNTL